MRKTLTCLVVDDMQNIRMVAKQILLNLGCESVLEAASGEEALRLLSNNEVDLIFLDIGLPQMSGIDCLWAIRSDPKTAHIRCVMVTSERNEHHVRKALAAGAAGYVVKPFTPRALEVHLNQE